MLLPSSSYLQQVSLDSYVYATDSLLEELSNATTLTKLVLHGCDLITDAGIKHLESKYSVHFDRTQLTSPPYQVSDTWNT